MTVAAAQTSSKREPASALRRKSRRATATKIAPLTANTQNSALRSGSAPAAPGRTGAQIHPTPAASPTTPIVQRGHSANAENSTVMKQPPTNASVTVVWVAIAEAGAAD